MTEKLRIEFRQCPHCAGYGVHDNGDNCRTCGGIGRGGLRSPPDSIIGRGEIMIERGTGRIVSSAEFAAAIRRSGVLVHTERGDK
jgi:hypothetical protein